MGQAIVISRSHDGAVEARANDEGFRDLKLSNLTSLCYTQLNTSQSRKAFLSTSLPILPTLSAPS